MAQSHQRQHEPLRVPSGWDGQERSLVIQLEGLFTELYNKFGRLRVEDLSEALRELLTKYGEDIEDLQETTVTNVAYDSTNKKLTKTINDVVSDIVTIAVIKTALELTKSDVGLGNVENKSSATIRSEITNTNVTTALGYTPADVTTAVTNVAYDSTNKKITKTTNGTTTDVVSVSTIQSALGGFTWGALKGS